MAVDLEQLKNGVQLVVAARTILGDVIKHRKLLKSFIKKTFKFFDPFETIATPAIASLNVVKPVKEPSYFLGDAFIGLDHFVKEFDKSCRPFRASTSQLREALLNSKEMKTLHNTLKDIQLSTKPLHDAILNSLADAAVRRHVSSVVYETIKERTASAAGSPGGTSVAINSGMIGGPYGGVSNVKTLEFRVPDPMGGLKYYLGTNYRDARTDNETDK